MWGTVCRPPSSGRGRRREIFQPSNAPPQLPAPPGPLSALAFHYIGARAAPPQRTANWTTRGVCTNVYGPGCSTHRRFPPLGRPQLSPRPPERQQGRAHRARGAGADPREVRGAQAPFIGAACGVWWRRTPAPAWRGATCWHHPSWWPFMAAAPSLRMARQATKPLAPVPRARAGAVPALRQP